MKAFVIAASAAGMLLAGPTPAFAESVVMGRDNNLCGFESTPDTNRPGFHIGEVHGGPVVTGAGAPGSPVSTISVRCSVQDGSSHAHADLASGWSTNGIGTAYVPPTVISYAFSGSPVYVCTQAMIDGVNYFWDTVSKQWSLSAGAQCAEAFWQEVPSLVLDDYLNGLDELVNNTLQQCRDGIDNDFDTKTDYPADPDCMSPYDVTEAF